MQEEKQYKDKGGGYTSAPKEKMNAKELFGLLLIGTSILDALKYSIQANKIKRERTAKSMSRKFINFAILNDLVKLGYGLTILDLYIISSSILALICMIQLFYTIYIFYPYRCRGLNGFKRPGILTYTINSALPNKLRKRL